jgi:hypothetical protein
MSAARNTSSTSTAATAPDALPHRRFWRIWAFVAVLAVDAISSLLLLTPLIHWIVKEEGRSSSSSTRHYTLHGSLRDLALCAVLRLSAAFLGLFVAYLRANVEPEHYPFALYHRATGIKKTREELEQEGLEEAFWPWLRRYLVRPSFGTEFASMVTQVLCVIKCLARMNVEIGTLQDAEPVHALFWIAVLVTAVLSILQAGYMDSICKLAGQYGKERLGESPRLFRQISSTLSLPLLARQNASGDEQDDEENVQDGGDPADAPGVSDITSDTDYRASWRDLLSTCRPDMQWIALAFVFLLLAAVAQVYIPRFLGNILDSLTATFSDADDDGARRKSMWEVPGFISNMKLLVLASILAGVFSGLRGSIFTVVGGRVNVRLRVKLMDSLLAQDIGFFDTSKTGEISSRLSSDTTLVGDQVSLNVNVFLRSLVQAIGVLLFMFIVSWQLSILAFISVPVITILSKWYSSYITTIIKIMQKTLADGNGVSEAALGSMSTIRAFDAAESELKEFEKYMTRYLHFNMKSAVAYCGYAALTTALPQLVFAVVGK